MKTCNNYAYYEIALPVYVRHHLSKGDPQLNARGFGFS